MRILITGIHGFVASHLIKVLWQRHVIYGLSTSLQPIKFVERIYLWDEIQQLPQVDVVIHLAAIAHDVNNNARAGLYKEVNHTLTCRIYDWFEKSTATKFIFFSSVKAVVDAPGDDVVTEETTPSPVGNYGKTKREAEEYLISKSHILDTPVAIQSSDKLVYILRPSMIYGEGNKGNLNLLYNIVRRGIPYPLGAFSNNRTFTAIENVTFVVDQLISHFIPSGIYNVCDDDSISTNRLVEIMCQVLRKKPCILYWDKERVRCLARWGGWLHLPLNPNRLSKLTENYRVSNKKILQALEIDSMPVSVFEAMARTIQSFENNNK